jgi:hypothetical protein
LWEDNFKNVSKTKQANEKIAKKNANNRSIVFCGKITSKKFQ